MDRIEIQLLFNFKSKKLFQLFLLIRKIEKNGQNLNKY